MRPITEFLSTDHRQCDDRYARAESAVGAGRWEEARTTFDQFRTALLRHFRMEEEVLFPAVDQATGSAFGPTAVMRLEHTQMRELVNGMGDAVENEDAARYLGLAETLLVLMQQHNFKEENILYPLGDRSLGNGAQALLMRLRTIE